MTSGPPQGSANGRWEHVHQCPQCRHIVRAEQIPRPAIISGVMTCPNCEWSGPINVQIVKRSSKDEVGNAKQVS
jgi:predicted RNA-binding Zn-ribbon protein involved in translation (DUF1610 family)